MTMFDYVIGCEHNMHTVSDLNSIATCYDCARAFELIDLKSAVRAFNIVILLLILLSVSLPITSSSICVVLFSRKGKYNAFMND